MLGTLEKHDTKTFDLTCFVGEVQSIVQGTVLWIYHTPNMTNFKKKACSQLRRRVSKF